MGWPRRWNGGWDGGREVVCGWVEGEEEGWGGVEWVGRELGAGCWMLDAGASAGCWVVAVGGGGEVRYVSGSIGRDMGVGEGVWWAGIRDVGVRRFGAMGCETKGDNDGACRGRAALQWVGLR